jgi:hypothetical protein
MAAPTMRIAPKATPAANLLLTISIPVSLLAHKPQGAPAAILRLRFRAATPLIENDTGFL